MTENESSRSLVPLHFRRLSNCEIKNNLASISSSLLPVFGTVIDDAYLQHKKNLMANVFGGARDILRMGIHFVVSICGNCRWTTLICDEILVLYGRTSTLPFELISKIFTGEWHTHKAFLLLNLLRLWRLRRVKELFKSNRIVSQQRDSINEVLLYARKNRLPEGIREQMVAHIQLKFKTAELQQEVLKDLSKAIRSSIAQHLFQKTVEKTYLFRRVSENLVSQLVSEMKAEYFPQRVEITLQNEIPTEYRVLHSSIGSSGCGDIQEWNGADMAGEIGVIFNIPQPFTVRTKRLSQVIRISHHHFKTMLQSGSEDGNIMLA
ncbi:hypothetical protein F3Y22_tig00117048pilonHSYRG00888 [Hibiscus syriacus]|uniref:Cyclic nucleotide-binding domain-containing protein n=1 Tax=Hibiscus syriacus TaxID=106335 RepID=A0A6A2XL38_HIBSY|nr:hypothetical protein F3Y22_tig00117048pilonHSYRG00888 [Hibiscus syriacus]